MGKFSVDTINRRLVPDGVGVKRFKINIKYTSHKLEREGVHGLRPNLCEVTFHERTIYSVQCVPSLEEKYSLNVVHMVSIMSL